MGIDWLDRKAQPICITFVVPFLVIAVGPVVCARFGVPPNEVASLIAALAVGGWVLVLVTDPATDSLLCDARLRRPSP
jgi:hypothetical protein